ncbi:MAG: GIY-YIG nuclease family protein [Moorea sp. SIO4G2]|nr:GIY-YIG nuclease family protein [Moorena sp. SIO4G2]
MVIHRFKVTQVQFGKKIFKGLLLSHDPLTFGITIPQLVELCPLTIPYGSQASTYIRRACPSFDSIFTLGATETSFSPTYLTELKYLPYLLSLFLQKGSSEAYNLLLEHEIVTKGLSRPQAEKAIQEIERERLNAARIRMQFKQKKEKLVYLVADTQHNVCKIGVSLDPIQRLKSLQGGYPWILELLGTIPGGGKREVALHKLFHTHRLEGEWFTLHYDILQTFGVPVTN